MYLIRGTRKARIKTYQIHDRQCDHCKDFDLTLKVYKDYFHVYFIPIIPSGVKTTVINCKSCGSLIRIDSLSKEYESKTKIPFYLYGGVIIAALFVLSIFAVRAWNQHENSSYVSNPKVGDVYLLKSEENTLNGYEFIRLRKIEGDSVTAYGNHVLYLSYTSSFSTEDYFDTERELRYTVSQLRRLPEKDTVEKVYRDYDGATDFNRIR